MFSEIMWVFRPHIWQLYIFTFTECEMLLQHWTLPRSRNEYLHPFDQAFLWEMPHAKVYQQITVSLAYHLNIIWSNVQFFETTYWNGEAGINNSTLPWFSCKYFMHQHFLRSISVARPTCSIFDASWFQILKLLQPPINWLYSRRIIYWTQY